ncbi:metallophosphoesterase [Bacillus horti]|uniref:MPP superfamily phosphohydrolase n=1 Tax=Caldalkalibacillus horti TaxID=77523 RepID=A0ABT9W269_9BACI|nr:metallophosphoesterase [Bacillus horti]MDQ0167210.1 putative MPP superfamily phosphohydrolase [Bacillus horti]
MNARRFLGRIGLFLVIYLVLLFYVGIHGWWYLNALIEGFNGFPSVIYWIVFSFIGLAYLIAMLGRKALPYSLSPFFKYTGALWLAAFQYSVILLPIADIMVGILSLFSAPLQTSVIILGTIVVIVLTSILILGSWNAWNPKIRKVEITVPKSGGNIESLKIAVASDLHLGVIVGNKHIKRLLKTIEIIKPDLVLLPGDVLDDELKPFIHKKMADTLQHLRAPLGVYAVLGNHEYIGGNSKEYISIMKEIDIQVLTDETILIEDSFYIIGRKDRAVKSFGFNQRVELSELISTLDQKKPILLMDHQPTDLKEPSELGIDVMLSGHTHRGQLAPNHWITQRMFELDYGYLQKESMHAIVSSGFGTWGPPVRIGSRSEVVELTIHFNGTN